MPHKEAFVFILAEENRDSEEGSSPGEKRQMPRSIIPMLKSP